MRQIHSFFYTAEWLNTLASQLGDEGRRFYIISRLRFDFLWPVAFTFFFFNVLALLYKDMRLIRYLLLLPIFGLIFDYLENVSVSVVFAMYPRTLVALSHLAGIFTMFKWTAIYTTFIVIVVGIIRLAGKSVRGCKA